MEASMSENISQADGPTHSPPDIDPFAPSPDQDEDREGWLAWRRLGCTSTDIPKLLGESQYGDQLKVWRDKMGLLPDEFAGDEKKQAILRRGKKLEPIAAEEFTEATGLEVERCDTGIVHPTNPRLRATPDYRIADQDDGRGPGTLEIKTVSQAVFQKILRYGARKDHLLQWHQETLVTGDRWGGIFYLQPDTFQHKWFPLEPAAEVHELIEMTVNDFWPLVEAGTPPEDIDAPKTKPVKVPAADGDVRVLDDDRLEQVLADRDLALQLIAEGEDLKADADSAVKLLLKEHDAQVAEAFGRRIFSRVDVRRGAIDYKKACLALIDQHKLTVDLERFRRASSTSDYYRVFDLKG